MVGYFRGNIFDGGNFGGKFASPRQLPKGTIAWWERGILGTALDEVFSVPSPKAFSGTPGARPRTTEALGAASCGMTMASNEHCNHMKREESKEEEGLGDGVA